MAGTLRFRNIPIHTCDKVPRDYNMVGLDIAFIKAGICPFCHESINIKLVEEHKVSSPKVDEILNEISLIHKKKNADYATDDNPFSNFERASTLSSWFKDKDDKVFTTMLGIKLARLAELRNGKTPNNESIEDSFLDLCTYAVLWYAWYITRFGGEDNG